MTRIKIINVATLPPPIFLVENVINKHILCVRRRIDSPSMYITQEVSTFILVDVSERLLFIYGINIPSYDIILLEGIFIFQINSELCWDKRR